MSRRRRGSSADGGASGKGAKDRAITIGCSVVAFVAGMVVLYFAWQQQRVVTADQPSTCTVVKSWVSSSTESSYKPYTPEVTLAHDVDGQHYERTDDGARTSDSGAAHKLVAQYPTGGRVPCAYVAGRPDLVTVFHTPAGFGLFGFGFFLAVILPVTLVSIDRVRARKRG
jgi:hypothetical protein